MTIIKQAIDDDVIYTLENTLDELLKDEMLIELFNKKEILDTYIWGVPKSTRNSNLIKVICQGDIMIFGQKNKIKYIGEIIITSLDLNLRDEEPKLISNVFWAKDDYELLYFMKPVITVSGDMSNFNSYIGYNESAMFRGISRVAKSDVKNGDDGKITILKLEIIVF